MSLQIPTDAASTARLFRSRVLKPAEGVFLFHPRAMERLIAEHLESQGYAGAIPDLGYYLMPAVHFLTGLESENPEALAVIEGLNLPDQVILLPMPVEQRLDQAGFTRLLRDYWARRFEGEIARAWEASRYVCQDCDPFALDALQDLIGAAAFAEVRDLLTRDGVIPAGLDDAVVCRSFVAFVTRLRYFSPGVRAFFFPAIHDWARLDRWMVDGGLDLPPLRAESRLPPILERTRPDPRCGHPSYTPLLPVDLPYASADPDCCPALVSAIPAHPAATLPAEIATPDLFPDTPSLLERCCLAALDQDQPQFRDDWRIHLQDALIGIIAPLLDLLLAFPTWLKRRGSLPEMAQGIHLNLSLRLFRHAVRTARRAGISDSHAIVIDQLAAANWRFQAMGEACPGASGQVTDILARQRHAAESSLSALLVDIWALDQHSAEELTLLTRRLGAAILDSPHAWAARILLKNLERVLLESRTTYYQLRPLQWLFSLGRISFRQTLPFQANLKALRAIDTGLSRLEQLGWLTTEVERFSQPLQALARRLTAHLEKQLKPLVRAAIHEAGFTPANHREEVAAHKLLRELLDVIEQRRHLKFTDVRDIIARNLLRLPDLSIGEFLKGDRLARFDRVAARTLPGIYQPGEFYIRGLQQLGAPLFGTPLGRLALRHLILPFGLAFLGLKTLDVLTGILSHHQSHLHLTPFWLIGSVGLLINAMTYTRVVRHGALAVLRGIWWGLRLLFYDGLRRLMHWQPIVDLLENTVVRMLDRYLLRPFLIGMLLILPFLGLASLVESALIEPGISLFALALTLGTLLHNTPSGRHLLDDAASRVGRFLRLVNQTLIFGLVRELMQFFKDINRRFQQGLHWIEELLSHRLGESRSELTLKAVLIPVWRVLDSLIQFYVTVLVEPQVNPIKHFPLVTIGHKVMLPFFPVITGFLFTVTETLLPKWLTYPLVTLTVLLLPGLAGFLVWELKENWKLYAANHRGLGLAGSIPHHSQAEHRPDPSTLAVEPAVIGRHGETMRGLLRRGFHSGTLPKAFDRLRRVLRQQIHDEIDLPARLRESRRHLIEVERAICVFCDRELGYALRCRCRHPHCDLGRIESRRPRLATNSFEMTIDMYPRLASVCAPITLHLSLCLQEPDLRLTVTIKGDRTILDERCWRLVQDDIRVFSGRAGASQTQINLTLVEADAG